MSVETFDAAIRALVVVGIGALILLIVILVVAAILDL